MLSMLSHASLIPLQEFFSVESCCITVEDECSGISPVHSLQLYHKAYLSQLTCQAFCAVFTTCWYCSKHIAVKQNKADTGVRNSNELTATGKSHTIWDNTVLPATRQRWLSCFYPSRSWYLIWRPLGNARLSWPGWWLYFKIVYPPKVVTCIVNNWKVSWLGIEPATESLMS